MEKLKNQIWKHLDGVDVGAYEDALSLCREYESVGFKTAHAWNHELREKTSIALTMAVQNQRWSDAEKLDQLIFRSLIFGAPHYFDDYLQCVEYGKPLGKKFYLPRRGYLRRYVNAYQKILDGELDFLSISMPKRALANGTSVLTTEGFKKHGDLVVGDYVYGRDSKPKRVTAVHPKTKIDYKVTFSNGQVIYANGDHLWTVWDRGVQRECVLSTTDILRKGLKNKDRWRMLLPMCEDIDGEDIELPVDPYSLGAWLGDGTTAKPVMTNDKRDIAIVDKMSAKYPIQNQCVDKNYGTIITAFSKEFLDALQSIGMCHRGDKRNKYIPDVYFTASKRQRLELLAGLIDTDGTIDKGKHRVTFSTTLPSLRDAVLTLASSFGWDARYHTAPPTVSSSGVVGRHDVFVVTFVPDIELPVVVERKKNKPTGLPRRISIRSIEHLADAVEGNCITVEGHEYRVGKTMVLTHNCGKSQMGINFVNMLSGKFPDKSTLMEGTGDDLVMSFYKGCLEYIQQPNDYHFYDIFPDSKLVQTNADTKSINLVQKSRFPTIMCRSVDSRQVGLSEATNLLYLDDMVEGREEAKNRTRLGAKWEVISGDVIGRAIEGTPIVICGTRYSLYDPIGRLQEEMKQQNKRIEIIETPALDLKTDESNFEFERDGQKVFTTQYFRDQRQMLSAEQFESEFQQTPFEAKGLLFPKEKLNYFFELPVDVEPDAIMAVCDTAESGSDYTAMPIAAIYGDEVYIIDVVFDDSPPEVTKPECVKAIINNRVSEDTFESNNAGSYYARDVNEMLVAKGYHCAIRTKRTISNKQTRIEFASDNIIKNFYFRDWSTIERGGQYWEFMTQVTTHTRSGKVPHDDAPDSLSLLENELRMRIGVKPEIMKRPF